MIIAGNHRTKTPGIAVAALIADTTKSDGECELHIWEGCWTSAFSCRLRNSRCRRDYRASEAAGRVGDRRGIGQCGSHGIRDFATVLGHFAKVFEAARKRGFWLCWSVCGS